MILKANKSFVNDPIYISLEKAISVRQNAIQYPSLLKHHICKIVPFVLQNITEAFDVTGVRYLESNSSITIFPVYDSSFQNTQSTILACQKQRKWIIEQCRGKNKYESALRVHNLLAQNVRYGDKGADSHTIVGPLLFQTAVCDGFAKAYKYILDSLNVPCCVVRGFAQEPLTKMRVGHTWNMAFLDQIWSHIDVTFDTTIMANGKLRYDYFGLNTRDILRDHQFNQKDYPPAPSNENCYYYRQGILIISKVQLLNILRQTMFRKENEIVFQIVEGLRNPNFESEINAVILQAAQMNNIGIEYSMNYNLDQGVFQIFLSYF